MEVQKIGKTCGSGETAVQALKDVSFSVSKRGYVAVAGESGSRWRNIRNPGNSG